MGFVKSLARGGMFGLLGHALAKKDKKDKPVRPPSLMTEGYSSGGSSLIGSRRDY